MDKFTVDYTSNYSNQWMRVLKHLQAQPFVRGLEIGCLEGRSSCWFSENILTGSGSTLDCVDAWSGDFKRYRATFEQNTSRYRSVIRAHETNSFDYLTLQNQSSPKQLYDFIYIDGDHAPSAVLSDLVLAWPLLKPGGILICDDYLFVNGKEETRTGIDAFFACRNDWKLLDQGWQFTVRKLTGIEAVVVSVDYADYLTHTLPMLVRHVDHVVVATSIKDQATAGIVEQYALAELVATDAFYYSGATFNKGAAINVALERLTKSAWVLLVDADIAIDRTIPLPPALIDRQAIWGTQRCRVKGHTEFEQAVLRRHAETLRASDCREGLLGFFQLWHWPHHPRYVPSDCKDAAVYDVQFANQWPLEHQKFLPSFSVLHLETPEHFACENWRGRRSLPFISSTSQPDSTHDASIGNESQTRGVLTASNSSYWLTLRVLAESLFEQRISLAVVDHGLTSKQRSWLEHHGAQVLDIEHPTGWNESQFNHVDGSTTLENAYLKPWLCLHSPYDKTIWVDADAVLLRNAERVFELLDEGPWLTLESWATSDAMSRLYSLFVHSIYARLPKRYAHAHQVNTGVFAFHRNDRWLREWWHLTLRIINDQRLRSLCRLRDQGTLVALISNPTPDFALPRIMLDKKLNWPANGVTAAEHFKRQKYDWQSASVLNALRTDHPDVTIVHWMGAPKPSKLNLSHMSRERTLTTLEHVS